MKRIFTLSALLMFALTAVKAQSLSAVLGDEKMERYVWAIGYGTDIESADQDAINTLSSNSMERVVVSEGKMVDVNSTEGSTSTETFKQKSVGVSNLYLENMRREILPDENGQKRVLRYVTREDWDSRYERIKEKIERYKSDGDYTPEIDDKLRNYVWAHILSKNYPKKDLFFDNLSAEQWLLNKIDELLGDIEIKVTAIRKNKNDKINPNDLYLDFIYNDEPISHLVFNYFDGTAYIDGQTVSNGQSMISVKRVDSTLAIEIDCTHTQLARQLDPNVHVLLQNPAFQSIYKGCRKEIAMQPKGVKASATVDINSEKVVSAVKNSREAQLRTYAPIKEQVATAETQIYAKILSDVTASFSKLSSPESIRKHFTDKAWREYQDIVVSGNPRLVGTPSYKFLKHDSLVICRSIPLKLKFKGNYSFNENVVFRFGSASKKIVSVAYQLDNDIDSAILEKQWDDAARLTLLIFLEDYRTAYCLRDIEYINKVFSDDAYIIVGKVLEKSKKRFDDNPYDMPGMDEKRVKYIKLSKGQYIKNLRQSFTSKEFVNIRFSEFDTDRGYGGKEGIYAVQMRQRYYSNNYADDGVLTLAIDMKSTDNPLVRVRIWHEQRLEGYSAESMINKVSVSGSLD
jgi:hypothetical protein